MLRVCVIGMGPIMPVTAQFGEIEDALGSLASDGALRPRPIPRARTAAPQRRRSLPRFIDPLGSCPWGGDADVDARRTG